MSFELVIVGGGNMGAALLGGMLDAGIVPVSDLAIVEPLGLRRTELSERFGSVTVTEQIPTCVSAVLAVQPPDVPIVAAEITDELGRYCIERQTRIADLVGQVELATP